MRKSLDITVTRVCKYTLQGDFNNTLGRGLGPALEEAANKPFEGVIDTLLEGDSNTPLKGL